ncbi:uncharacterized protein K489DRAFT_389272 [Dissoconium aciculare CBS 342.82]|uniref:Uncharacterized protein n=1 Tax=Dissoconium aciculare CBS 342.82 TaxID=1314786 RepID=A0A6J3M307_9PEZI|nr:uncharacterized protein K489DRAFT_389272 [Dissoconium aciculare CBS 342.82]KAF1822411.1 hypothetical protein K489DRAFT_389272 [Dissoconium aciculare CBS 342.82]
MAPVPEILTVLFKRMVTNEAHNHPTPTHVGGSGSVSPDSISNPAIFALFAFVGVGMIVASLWFFFWAKNGGFQWKQNDWEEYKSTVLRRKGPDGRTLSNATKSTKLGNGTIVGTQHYAWEKEMARSVVGRDEKGRKGILGRRGWGGTHSVFYDDGYMTESFATRTVVTDEMSELRSDADTEEREKHTKRYRDRDVQQYKKERPARVGGLNRVADGSHFDYTNSERSDIMTETVISDSSTHPMLEKPSAQEIQARKDKERAERKARDEVARMERRWKREAEEAAAMLARENQRPAPTLSRKSALPSSSRPISNKQHGTANYREASPRKRDFSYQDGPESEILSTSYTESVTTASDRAPPSYYDRYRPNGAMAAAAAAATRYPPSASDRSARHSSPKKKPNGGGGGYRRGGNDSDLD